MISVANNLVAMNSRRQFNITNAAKAKSMEKLSSGYRINRAADDAAGLAISEKMRYQIRGLNRGAENIMEGISLCQVADGALAEVDDMLHRLNELSVKSSNGTYSNTDRKYIQEEVDQIVSEVDRIGKATTFNELHIFDIDEIESKIGKITTIVSSPSADSGRLSEAYQVGSKWYPSASMDFSSVQEKDISKMKDSFFSFNCSASCNEAFKFTLKTDGTPSYFDPSTAGRHDTHQVYVDISGCKNGTEIVNKIFEAAKLFTPVSVDSATSTVAASVGGTAVSHSNVLAKSGSTLYLIGTGQGGKTSESAAKNVFSSTSAYGRADCSSLTNGLTKEPVYVIPIQCSSNVEDRETVRTKAMNASLIGIGSLDISTQVNALNAIERIKGAFEYIADMRSDIGAQQNRLEHTYQTNLNTSENTQAAESLIRDTDMAKEMVSYSMKNILAQAGISMLSQANQSNQAILSLLQ